MPIAHVSCGLRAEAGGGRTEAGDGRTIFVLIHGRRSLYDFV